MKNFMMVVIVAVGLFFVFECTVCYANAQENKEDLTVIRDNMRTYLKGTVSDKGIPLPQADGTWSDIDYQNKNNGRWRTMTHLSRARSLSSNPANYKETILALRAWLKKDPQNPNWWWSVIGVPQSLCETMILLGDAMPQDLLDAYRPILNRSTPGMTGENKVWVAEIHVMKGILYHNSQMVKEGCAQILSELRIVPFGKEGIQKDYTFHQHGSQLQIGNYGLGFFCGMTQWALFLKGSSFELNSEQIELLDHLFYDMGCMAMYRGFFDYNACGRQLSLNIWQTKHNALYHAAQRLIPFLPKERQKLYREIMPGNNQVSVRGCGWYPCSTYLIHRPNENYYFSVRMSTPSIIGCETVNSENASGRFQADGATFLMKDTMEYRNILPYWNWRHLPGTTELQDNQSLTASGIRNKKGFAAGLTFDDCSIAVMKFAPKELEARKIWFCFPDQILCHGFGIQSRNKGQVHTTIDQTKLLGPVTLYQEGKLVSVKEGITELNGPASVFHYGTEYQLPKKGNYYLKISEEKGNIKTVNAAEPSQPLSGKVFLLVCNHGEKPNNGTYDYILKPLSNGSMVSTLNKNTSKADETKAVSVKENMANIIELQTSSPEIYAAQEKSSGIIMIAAFKSGNVALPDGSNKIIKNPSIIILRNGKEKTENIQ